MAIQWQWRHTSYCVPSAFGFRHTICNMVLYGHLWKGRARPIFRQVSGEWKKETRKAPGGALRRSAPGQKKRRHENCDHTINTKNPKSLAIFVPSFFLPSSLRSGTKDAKKRKASFVPSLRLEKFAPFLVHYLFFP